MSLRGKSKTKGSNQLAAIASAGLVRILLGAGKATPGPPLGPVLGQRGLKAIDFCKDFNNKTSNYKPGTLLPTYISVTSDRAYTFTVKTPQTVWLLKQAAQISKGKPGLSGDPVALLNVKAIYEIGRIKHLDCPHLQLETVCRAIVGTARSMGIKVVL